MPKTVFHCCLSFAWVLLFSLGTGPALHAQKVDSIAFHLYTDSLKKGVHNYINVDARLSDGRWQPLTAKELNFSASAGRFEGTSLLIDSNFKGDRVTVKAVLKSDTTLWRETTIFMKTVEVTEKLPTMEEVMDKKPAQPRKRRRQ